jgi:heme exporter protein C
MAEQLARERRYEGRVRAERRVSVDWLLVAAGVALAAAVVRAALFTPTEARQGPAQKIFYVHVPAAAAGLYLACPLAALASVLYLWLRDEKLDRVAESAAEVGLVFLSVVLVTGPLWARPVWGVWWAWDPNLTMTVILWAIYASYLMLRAFGGEDDAVRRYAAVLGIVGFLDVPIVHQSVTWWRGQHPGPIVTAPGGPAMPAEMFQALLVSLVGFTLLGDGLRDALDPRSSQRR